MSKTKYREALAAVGLTQVGASEFFGVDRKTSPRWARGESPVHEAAAKLLRVMMHYKISADDVERLE